MVLPLWQMVTESGVGGGVVGGGVVAGGGGVADTGGVVALLEPPLPEVSSPVVSVVVFDPLSPALLFAELSEVLIGVEAAAAAAALGGEAITNWRSKSRKGKWSSACML